MSFSNDQIDLNQLPDADQVRWQTLAPKYRYAVLVQGLLEIAALIAVAAAIWFFAAARLSDLLSLSYLIAGIAFIAVLNFVLPQIAIRFKRYAVREHDVQYRTGVVLRKRIAVPINRIQHVEIGTGPIDRLFGLARLQLFTAGSAGGDLSIHGLDHQSAETLRRYLLDKARHAY